MASRPVARHPALPAPGSAAVGRTLRELNDASVRAAVLPCLAALQPWVSVPWAGPLAGLLAGAAALLGLARLVHHQREPGAYQDRAFFLGAARGLADRDDWAGALDVLHYALDPALPAPVIRVPPDWAALALPQIIQQGRWELAKWLLSRTCLPRAAALQACAQLAALGQPPELPLRDVLAAMDTLRFTQEDSMDLLLPLCGLMAAHASASWLQTRAAAGWFPAQWTLAQRAGALRNAAWLLALSQYEAAGSWAPVPGVAERLCAEPLAGPGVAAGQVASAARAGPGAGAGQAALAPGAGPGLAAGQAAWVAGAGPGVAPGGTSLGVAAAVAPGGREPPRAPRTFAEHLLVAGEGPMLRAARALWEAHLAGQESARRVLRAWAEVPVPQRSGLAAPIAAFLRGELGEAALNEALAVAGSSAPHVDAASMEQALKAWRAGDCAEAMQRVARLAASGGSARAERCAALTRAPGEALPMLRWCLAQGDWTALGVLLHGLRRDEVSAALDLLGEHRAHAAVPRLPLWEALFRQQQTSVSSLTAAQQETVVALSAAADAGAARTWDPHESLSAAFDAIVQRAEPAQVPALLAALRVCKRIPQFAQAMASMLRFEPAALGALAADASLSPRGLLLAAQALAAGGPDLLERPGCQSLLRNRYVLKDETRYRRALAGFADFTRAAPIVRVLALQALVDWPRAAALRPLLVDAAQSAWSDCVATTGALLHAEGPRSQARAARDAAAQATGLLTLHAQHVHGLGDAPEVRLHDGALAALERVLVQHGAQVGAWLDDLDPASAQLLASLADDAGDAALQRAYKALGQRAHALQHGAAAASRPSAAGVRHSSQAPGAAAAPNCAPQGLLESPRPLAGEGPSPASGRRDPSSGNGAEERRFLSASGRRVPSSSGGVRKRQLFGGSGGPGRASAHPQAHGAHPSDQHSLDVAHGQQAARECVELARAWVSTLRQLRQQRAALGGPAVTPPPGEFFARSEQRQALASLHHRLVDQQLEALGWMADLYDLHQPLTFTRPTDLFDRLVHSIGLAPAQLPAFMALLRTFRRPRLFWGLARRVTALPQGKQILQGLLAARLRGEATYHAVRAASPEMRALFAEQPQRAALQAAWEAGATLPGTGPLQGLSLCDTADFADLASSGDEVSGSCHSVLTGEYAPLLLARMMDGSKRMLALKDASGTMKARAMLRLMHTEAGAPALLVSVLYVANMDDAESGPALVDLALQRARALGLPLYGAAELVPGGTVAPVSLLSQVATIPEYWDELRSAPSGTARLDAVKRLA